MRRYRSLSGGFAAIAMTMGTGVLFVAAAPAAFAGTVTSTFSTPGGPYDYTVPTGVTTVHVTAVGGRGFSFGTIPAAAVVTADLAVTPGAMVRIHVAGDGSRTAGGANGGGAPTYPAGNGGGGASDIRVGTDALSARVLAAAGSGGYGFSSGGAAGQPGTISPGCTAAQGATAAEPGTQSAGGVAGTCPDHSPDYVPGTDGTLGQGGSGGNRPSGGDGGGGGGGGYYGGGGGSAYGGGAGGSSYTAAALTNTSVALAAASTAPVVTISYTRTATRVAVAVVPGSVTADGSSTATATATVRDTQGNPVAGDAVAFAASDPGVTFGAVSDNGDGTYTATVTASSTAHTVTVTATDSSPAPDLSGTTTWTLTAVTTAPTTTTATPTTTAPTTTTATPTTTSASVAPTTIAQTTMTITSSSPTSLSTSSSGALASTGYNPRRPIDLAAFLLVGGLVLAVLGRRRRSAPAPKHS